MLIHLVANPAFGSSEMRFHHPIPGGIVNVSLTSIDNPRPEVKFGNRRLLVMRGTDQWVALLGVALDTVPGRYIVSVNHNDDETDIREVNIKPHRYPVQKVLAQTGRSAGADRSSPQPLLSDHKSKVADCSSQWTEPLVAELPLRYPVPGQSTHVFGSRHAEAGQISQPTDHAVLEPQSGVSRVHAPDGGRVHSVIQVDTDRQVVCIDHGLGLISIIGPLQDLNVQIEDRVTTATALGTVVLGDGKLGRLQWFVALNGIFVNPMLLVENPE